MNIMKDNQTYKWEPPLPASSRVPQSIVNPVRGMSNRGYMRNTSRIHSPIRKHNAKDVDRELDTHVPSSIMTLTRLSMPNWNRTCRHAIPNTG